MSNIFYCLASAYRSKSWKRQSSKENEGKIPLGKERKKEKQAGDKYRELIYGHSPKGHGRQWKEWNWWWKAATQTNIPKNAIFKKAAGNQAGVLWEFTNIMSALTYGNHQLCSMSHPCSTPDSRELHRNFNITPRAHLKRKARHPRLSTASGCDAATCWGRPCARSHALVRACKDPVCFDWVRWWWQITLKPQV